MQKKLLVTGATFGLLSVVIGAFGAHALKEAISPDRLVSFETGVRYQMYHALFLIVVSRLSFIRNKPLNIIYLLTFIGVVFFSGSIYLLATNDLTSINFKAIGFITPIGGLLLILSWLLLLIQCLKYERS